MSEVKERPILFSTEMVKAILEGRKTQTRRVIKPQPKYYTDHKFLDFGWAQFYDSGFVHTSDKNGIGGENWHHVEGENKYSEALKRTPFENPCPFGRVGDKLWVRETICNGGDGSWFYKAQAHSKWEHVVNISKEWDLKNCHKGRIPSIHMPRWASRITLEITDIRVERMQDGGDREFWGEEKWNENPFVWVIEFKNLN